MDASRRHARHRRLRARISGTADRPRVSVHRSSRYLHVQVIDDAAGTTLVASSSKGLKGATPVDRAGVLGQQVAKDTLAKGISQVVFDRGGYRYHGRVAALAEGLREGGLTL